MKQTINPTLESNDNVIENIMNIQSDQIDEAPAKIIQIECDGLDNHSQEGTTKLLTQASSGLSVVSNEEMAQTAETMQAEDDLFVPLDMSEGMGDDEIEMLVPFLDTLQSLLGTSAPLDPANPIQNTTEKVTAVKAKSCSIEKRRAAVRNDSPLPFAFQCHRKS